MLAENEEGYRNLVRITSEASLHGFYRKPRVSKNFLAKHAKGLIGFSGCLAGELCGNLMAGKYEEARATAAQYQDIFGRGNFFLEIQDQGLELEKKIHADLFRLEKDLDIPLVATNDSHYLCEDDHHAHEVLLCVQTAGSIHDPKRFKFDSDQFYVKTAEEMERLFSHAPEVVSRTMQFAERCSLKLSKVTNPFPEFAVPDGETLDSYFAEVCREGFRKRLDTAIRTWASAGCASRPIPDYEERLEREIDCIKQMKFPGYFMIVWDFIRYAREVNIPVGPGRGSAAGSLVSYCMEITDIDPLQNAASLRAFSQSRTRIHARYRYRLLHEPPRRSDRLCAPANMAGNRSRRSSPSTPWPPGCDQGCRPRARSALRRSRPHRQDGPRHHRRHYRPRRCEDSPQLQEAYDKEPQVKELVDTATKLEGLVRGAGVHAAGVVIAPQPLPNWFRSAAARMTKSSPPMT